MIQSSIYHSVVKSREAIMSMYRTCLSLLLAQICVLGAARAASSNAFRRDYTYWPEAEGWLKLHHMPLDWHTARVHCFHEGAVLASPLTAGLQMAITKMLNQTEDSPPHVFSGVSATLSEGLCYSSIEGTPIDELFIKWYKNYGGHRQQENKKKLCLAYRSNSIEFYSCEEPLPYICYRKLSVTDELTDCGTVDRAYKLDARTGHCYKFHRHGTTWALAALVCQAEGGHLAVIDSQPEADLLAELFAANPTVLYTPNQNSAAVGFKKWGDNNLWWTIHGKLLEESGYSRWNKGQPDNYGGNQACGYIFRNGQLDDGSCNVPVAFICEKSPDSLTRDSPQKSLSLISETVQ